MRGAVVFLCVGLICSFAAQAQELPERSGYVNDLAHVLSEPTRTQLEATLSEYAQAKGRGVYVLLVPTLEGMSVNAYDEAITQAWALEQDHLFLLVSLEESALHISVGDRIKSLYPDAFLDGVLNAMIPALAQGDFDGGITQGVNRLIGAGSAGASQQESRDGTWRVILLAGALALSLLLYVVFLA